MTARLDGGSRSFYLRANGPEDYKVWISHLTALKEGRAFGSGEKKAAPKQNAQVRRFARCRTSAW
jgi:hypothetical protein